MILKLALIFFSLGIIPAFAQESSNPTLAMDTISIPNADFNVVSRDAKIIPLNEIHSVSWQVTIHNDLVYANPNGNAVVRFYDSNVDGKFFEIGMGSQPNNKYWVAINIPDDPGYVVMTSYQERGWVPEGGPSIIAYTDRAGLTVNNGQRIVLSNLDVETFALKSYSVWGLEGSQDPPAIHSGVYVMDIMSGNPTDNPLLFFPYVLAAGMGGLIAILLVTKKRSS